MASVFLIGFMATGKTTVGRELAARRGQRFVDLDDRVEESAGLSIPEVFARRGEGEFRRLENKVLREVILELESEPSVIATGGGLPSGTGNMEAMRDAGLVVELSTPLSRLLARAEADGGAQKRPLLAEGAEAAGKLFSARQPTYRRAHAVVMNDGAGVAETASRVSSLAPIAEKLGGWLPTASICAVRERAYPIVSGEGSLDRLGELVAEFSTDTTKVAVVTDDNVAPLYAARVEASLRTAGLSSTTHIVGAGESSKTPEEHSRLAGELIEAGLDRGSTVVALGGGVVGDLAGFVAASLFRGVALVQVPTTLLAMTDSAIGGKTGVNLARGKNLLGAFWQPKVVVTDPSTLATLPARERRAGIGELYKYGLLDGEELYTKIDRFVTEPDDGELATAVVSRCGGFKSWVVARDERETTGERALLNLGHTLGHAIERAAGYDGTVLHGEAVALGLIAAARVSHALGLASVGLEERIVGSLAAAELSIDLDAWLRPEVLANVGVDKKRTGKRIKFVAVRDVGDVETVTMDTSEIAKILLPPSAL